MEKLVIDRKRWLHGMGAGTLLAGKEWVDTRNAYINEASIGKMCCLGFYCKQLGVPGDQLKNTPYPTSLAWSVKETLPAWLLLSSREGTMQRLGVVNDKPLMQSGGVDVISESDRERRITELFALEGVEVEFIG